MNYWEGEREREGGRTLFHIFWLEGNNDIGIQERNELGFDVSDTDQNL